MKRDFPDIIEERAKDKYNFRFPGGESYADADRRAGAALDFIAGTGALRPLIVSHEMIGRMLIRNLLDQDPSEALLWNHAHDVIYRVKIKDRVMESIGVVGIETGIEAGIKRVYPCGH